MSRVLLYVRNVSVSYVGFIANMAAAFLLTPFIVEQLGDVRYGLWSLLVTLAGPMGVMDLGVRASLGRFVNFHLGRDEVEEANNVIATANVFLFGTGLLLLAVSAVLAVGLGGVFPHIGESSLPDARWAVLLIGVNMLVGFHAATPPVVLMAFDRFDYATGVDLASLGLRVGLTVWVLLAGWGLAALAAVQVASTLLRLAAGAGLAWWVFPSLDPWPTRFRREGMRKLLSFSVFVFLSNSSHQFMRLSDMLVISWMIEPGKPGSLARYSIGMLIFTYAGQLLQKLMGVVNPELHKACGRGDKAEIRWLFLRSANATACIGLGLAVGVGYYGGDFISLWIADDFEGAGQVLTTLAVIFFIRLATAGSGSVATGLGHVGFQASRSVLQLVVNVAASVLFVLAGYGIVGVALGTVVGFIVGSAPLLWAMRKWVDLRMAEYARRLLLPWLGVAGVFLGICWAVDRIPLELSWPTFLVKVIACVGLYAPLVFFTILESGDRRRLLARVGLSR